MVDASDGAPDCTISGVSAVSTETKAAGTVESAVSLDL
jgi:hypothetical protein